MVIVSNGQCPQLTNSWVGLKKGTTIFFVSWQEIVSVGMFLRVGGDNSIPTFPVERLRGYRGKHL